MAVSIASEITKKAKSNLAFALRVLPKDRREDMVVFYAFCRTVDDLADDLSVGVEERRRGLEGWARGLREGFGEEDVFGNEVMEMMGRRGVPVGWLLEVVEGCGMDLEPQRFGSWEELAVYTRKVAVVVGLVCTRIFGCVHEDSERYAEALGNALQLTNILRDVGEDLGNGVRIYLPLCDLMRFQYSERDLVGRVHDGRFMAMMEYEAGRAREFFREAEGLIPEVDRKALLPARIMAEIYGCLLERMRADGFRVFDRRYSISKLKKVVILLKHLVAG